MKVYITLSVLIIFVFTSCQSEANFEMPLESSLSKSFSHTEAIAQPSETNSTEAANGSIPSIISMEAKLVRKAKLNLQVENIEESIEEINQLAILNGGVISSLDLNQSSYTHSSKLELKVPSSQFNSTLNKLKSMALKVEQVKVDIDDVTNSYRDMESRLKVKKQVRDQLVNLLRNKAQSFEEIYYAENQIKNIQEEIESVESRYQYLQKQIAYSTISINLFEPVINEVQAESPTFFKEMLSQLSLGWYFIQEVVLFLAGVWPFLLIVSLIFLYKNKIRRVFY